MKKLILTTIAFLAIATQAQADVTYVKVNEDGKPSEVVRAIDMSLSSYGEILPCIGSTNNGVLKAADIRSTIYAANEIALDENNSGLKIFVGFGPKRFALFTNPEKTQIVKVVRYQGRLTTVNRGTIDLPNIVDKVIEVKTYECLLNPNKK